MEVIDFETFAARHGAPADFGDAGLHCGAAHVGRSTRRRQVEAQFAKDNELTLRREELRRLFMEKIAAGEIREPTRLEKLRTVAAGHPDNPSVQAARRILARMTQAVE